ncbi:glycosyltransferase [Roseateles sp. P5_E7]
MEHTTPSLGPRAPHLLDVSTFWGPTSGVRRVLMAKHDRLRALGWRHSIVAPGAQASGLIDCGGLAVPHGGGRVALGRSRAERQMYFLAPDVIEASDPCTLAWAALATAQRLQVPAVAFCHSDLPTLAARLAGGPRQGRVGLAAERLARSYLVGLYRRFDAVLAPSRSMAERLQAWGVPRVAVQPLGVDCSVFTPQARDDAWAAELCRTHGLGAETRLIICTSRFAAGKNLPLLADAVRLLGPGHLLVAVGSGPCPPTGKQVLVLPPEHDGRALARMVASADAYVDAGDQEAFGLGALQAMACGTPVVAADSGALAELAKDAGLLVPQPLPRLWAEAVDASLAGNNATLRRTALARAQAQDWPHVMRALTQRYTALLGRRATPVRQPSPPGAVAAVRPG